MHLSYSVLIRTVAVERSLNSPLRAALRHPPFEIPSIRKHGLMRPVLLSFFKFRLPRSVAVPFPFGFEFRFGFPFILSSRFDQNARNDNQNGRRNGNSNPNGNGYGDGPAESMSLSFHDFFQIT